MKRSEIRSRWRSKKKAIASRKNGCLGGRPKLDEKTKIRNKILRLEKEVEQLKKDVPTEIENILPMIKVNFSADVFLKSFFRLVENSIIKKTCCEQEKRLLESYMKTIKKSIR